ncbi:hypothetical protein GOA99_22855 [Sinorhizobium meliloti]|uniref:hypothetical protein n=2 Tax=Sinorhizobium TaxID=28105 RepID=UPI001294BFB1|nr:hypothetical protein [Sinorhizobium meliloti]GCA52815.1 hypothetical protein KGO5_05281 [Sinorhizobium sp. KGO-5]MDW9364155.1 hypothetical protein [Sinorhizobium meliloti]MDW9387467.1 hypothetical protein [Sinorhizobium meliloti]MDW9602108.1 hypothetical protein [Sinorhizobium meliloti]MQV06809.1 hypothetical protein [Sinorhizobium meliloti]
MSKMEYHYQTMGRILSFLVQKGFSRVDFDESDAMEILTERWGSEEEVLQTFADVLRWMNNEGLIRVSNIQEYEGGYAFSGVQLTSKGVAIIQVKPNDPELGESIEKKISESGSLEASVYTKIGSFVGGVIGGVTQALSG